MIAKLMKHPIVTFLAIVLGTLLGIYFPERALSLANWGESYLLLIQLTILPVLISGIISSVGRLTQKTGIFFRLTSLTGKVIVWVLLFTVLLGLGVRHVIQAGSDISGKIGLFVSLYRQPNGYLSHEPG